MNETGFNDSELNTHLALMHFLELYYKLPVQHPSEVQDVIFAVHLIQGILALRILRREHPEGWPTYNHRGEKV
jgi:hypothetical protein